MRILLVEDERHLAEALEQVLSRNNYSVDLAFDGEEGLYQALTGIHDIIVLDIMLPKRDGLSILEELRGKRISTPVLLLTARGETEDKVIGLDSGADDYLAKPFQTTELLARLRALGRRKGEVQVKNLSTYADLELNPHTLELKVNEKSYHLTLKESQLLEILMLNHDLTVSPGSIIEKIWGFEGDAEESHVQVYISFLRKKLSQMESKARIQTHRGVGYMLTVSKES
ncbi:MAG TPA: DNA-binding response regulator [Coriobacteriia bacterium]|nr:DNA-binding response regulator [Coriobacteriia bacterium]